MSKAYRRMHNPEMHAAKRLSYAKKVRELRISDRTGESPLLHPGSVDGSWRVAMTATRRERAAMLSLMDAGWRAWFPQETIWRELAAKREKAQINVPLFSRYIFVAGEGKKPIGDCRYVTMLLPYRVSARVIHDLNIRQSGGEFKTADLPTFEPGQAVKAEFGQISELSGIVRHANHERVRILTTLFGSEREIDIPVDRVRVA